MILVKRSKVPNGLQVVSTPDAIIFTVDPPTHSRVWSHVAGLAPLHPLELFRLMIKLASGQELDLPEWITLDEVARAKGLPLHRYVSGLLQEPSIFRKPLRRYKPGRPRTVSKNRQTSPGERLAIDRMTANNQQTLKQRIKVLDLREKMAAKVLNKGGRRSGIGARPPAGRSHPWRCRPPGHRRPA